jgi:hypothetical protein
MNRAANILQNLGKEWNDRLYRISRHDLDRLARRADAGCRLLRRRRPRRGQLVSALELGDFLVRRIQLNANDLASYFGARVITATRMSHQILANRFPFTHFVRFHDGGCGGLAIFRKSEGGQSRWSNGNSRAKYSNLKRLKPINPGL